MIQLTIPWPPRDLSPNARKHYMAKVKIKNDYKDACYMIAKQTGVTLPMQDIALDLLFIPPRNAGDIDNMLSSCKAALDGISKALGTNDKHFRPITIDMAKADKLNPRIIVRIGTE